MAWFEEQKVLEEGFSSLAITSVLQVWLPITYTVTVVGPVAHRMQYVTLSGAHKLALADQKSAKIIAQHTLTDQDRVLLSTNLAQLNGKAPFFVSPVIGLTKLVLPTGWPGLVVPALLKTLFSFLLNDANLQAEISYLSANLATGGKVIESWHCVSVGQGNTFFNRNVSYQVNIGSETRHFLLNSLRYALKP